MEIDETEIIKGIKSKKREDFAVLYDFYVKKIYNYLFYRDHMHKPTAEDLTSQTWLKAFEKIDSFDSSKGTFAGWLFRIARNNLIDHFRSQTETSALEEAWGVAGGDDIAKEAEFKFEIEAVKKTINKLAPLQKEIVFLRLFEDLSHKDIAQILEITESNSKMNFSRGLAKINSILKTELQ